MEKDRDKDPTRYVFQYLRRTTENYGPSIGVKVDIESAERTCYKLYNIKSFLFDYIHIFPKKGIIKILPNAKIE